MAEKGQNSVLLNGQITGPEGNTRTILTTADGQLQVLLVAEVDGSPGTYVPVKVDSSGYLLTKAAP